MQGERLRTFEIFLDDCTEGISMYGIKTRAIGKFGVAAVLGMCLTASTVGIASAATHSAKTTFNAKADKTVAFQGVITAVSATSVTALSKKGTSETFTIATTTKILHGATLAMGDRVEVRALAASPAVATSINVLGVKK